MGNAVYELTNRGFEGVFYLATDLTTDFQKPGRQPDSSRGSGAEHCSSPWSWLE